MIESSSKSGDCDGTDCCVQYRSSTFSGVVQFNGLNIEHIVFTEKNIAVGHYSGGKFTHLYRNNPLSDNLKVVETQFADQIEIPPIKIQVSNVDGDCRMMPEYRRVYDSILLARSKLIIPNLCICDFILMVAHYYKDGVFCVNFNLIFCHEHIKCKRAKNNNNEKNYHFVIIPIRKLP